MLEAPVEEVWSALTDPERLEEWFANDVELELAPGGEGTFRWDDGDERRAVVEAVEPERLFEFSWDGSRVCISLEEIAGGTRVVVTETPAQDGARRSGCTGARASASCVTDVFAALADPNRRHLLEPLARRDASVTELAQTCPSRGRRSRSTWPRCERRASSSLAASGASPSIG